MRTIRDAQFEIATALPAAGAGNLSAAIDLTQGGEQPEGVEIEIVVPDLPDLVDDKTATFVLHQAATTSYAAAAWCPTVVLTGAGGVGASGFTLKLRPPSNALRYIKLSQAVLTAGGDNTAIETALRLLF